MIWRLKFMDADGEFQFKDFETKQQTDVFIEKNNLKDSWHQSEQQSMIASTNESDFNKGSNVL